MKNKNINLDTFHVQFSIAHLRRQITLRHILIRCCCSSVITDEQQQQQNYTVTTTTMTIKTSIDILYIEN